MARIIPIVLVFLMAATCSSREEKETPRPKVVRMKVPEERPAPVPQKQEAKPPNKPAPQVEMVRAPSTASKPPEVQPPKPSVRPPLKQGYCRVGEGDSLFTVSGREDVYGDPLKWLSLFQLNQEVLGVPRHNILHRELPEDLQLRFVTQAEAVQNRAKFGKNTWVVNAISLETPEQLVPYALALMKDGHPVYMTKAKVKGREWFRLRVGFFKDRAAALSVGKKIMARLGIQGSWVADAPEELKEYGGYVG